MKTFLLSALLILGPATSWACAPCNGSTPRFQNYRSNSAPKVIPSQGQQVGAFRMPRRSGRSVGGSGTVFRGSNNSRSPESFSRGFFDSIGKKKQPVREMGDWRGRRR